MYQFPLISIRQFRMPKALAAVVRLLKLAEFNEKNDHTIIKLKLNFKLITHKYERNNRMLSNI